MRQERIDMGIDSGRAEAAMDFEMRTFGAHFDVASHIGFDVVSILKFLRLASSQTSEKCR